MGFPSKVVDPSIKTPPVGPRLVDLDFKIMFYTNAPMPPKAWPELKPPDEPTAESTDIFLGYDQEDKIWKSRRTEGEAKLTDPDGTSGGGWWQGVNCEGKIWQAESVHLIGIQSSWHKKKKYIRGCQIHHWLKLLYENEPELRETLRREFPKVFRDRSTPQPH